MSTSLATSSSVRWQHDYARIVLSSTPASTGAMLAVPRTSYYRGRWLIVADFLVAKRIHRAASGTLCEICVPRRVGLLNWLNCRG